MPKRTKKETFKKEFTPQSPELDKLSEELAAFKSKHETLKHQSTQIDERPQKLKEEDSS